MMTILWTLLKPHLERIATFAVKLPWQVWVAALVLAAGWWHVRQDRARRSSDYEWGRVDALKSAHFDSALVATIAKTRDTAAARTDTVVRIVTKQVRRVDSIRVPDTVRVQFPVVDTLVVESKALVVAVDSLTRALAIERAATVALVSTLQQSVEAARLTAAREGARAQALEKRPTRLRTVGYVLAAGFGGYAAGRR